MKIHNRSVFKLDNRGIFVKMLLKLYIKVFVNKCDKELSVQCDEWAES